MCIFEGIILYYTDQNLLVNCRDAVVEGRRVCLAAEQRM